MITEIRPQSNSALKLERIRHSCAHVLAMAVQNLYPETKVTIGPVTETGFYYDFDRPSPFTPEELGKIEKKMRAIIKANHPIIREFVEREEIKAEIEQLGENYKLEILDSIPEEENITRYWIGSPDFGKVCWWDLCRGPHINYTGEIDPNAFTLESVAGAYWRGDETKPQLQRIYGTAWENPQQLQEYLTQKEEARKRDHRKLGKELKLFSIQEDAGGGLVFWHPQGAMMRYLIEDYWRKAHLEADYQLLYTPHVANLDLWKTSGHWDFYRENMFDSMEIENQTYQIKPMNCPFHVLTYKQELHSYRDFPLRWAELGTVYRYERSGVLHGLMRVRGFTQDDAHIFCSQGILSSNIISGFSLL